MKKITLEAMVRLVKLVKIDSMSPADAVTDIETSFGIHLKGDPEEIYRHYWGEVIHQLSIAKGSRSRIVKLLKQAQLIEIIE